VVVVVVCERKKREKGNGYLDGYAASFIDGQPAHQRQEYKTTMTPVQSNAAKLGKLYLGWAHWLVLLPANKNAGSQ